jgi:predicted cation transporter
MGRFGRFLAMILTGFVSAVVFIVVFAVTALPALTIVEDDNAYITWSALIACVAIGIGAAHVVNRWLRQRWSR